MKRRLAALAGVFVLFLTAGCITLTMQSYVDHDLRDAIEYYGPPDNAFDMVNGQRAFQWKEKDIYVDPPEAETYRYAREYGVSQWYDPQALLDLGDPNTDACVYTIYARYYQERQGWIVENVFEPKRRCVPFQDR